MLDAIIGHASATRAGDYKAAQASTNTLLACALTCRAMLSPAQVHLYNFVRRADSSLRTHAPPTTPALGLHVKGLEMRY